MNNQNNDIDQLTPELIELYLTGKLDAAQAHQVERLMLQSEFDAEAMEGFESQPTNIQHDLALLNDQLEERLAQEKNDPRFLWIKIAASVFILALSSYLVWDIVKEESAEPITISKDERQEENTLGSDQPVNVNDSSLLALNETTEEETETKDLSKKEDNDDKPNAGIPKEPPQAPTTSNMNNDDLLEVVEEDFLAAEEVDIIEEAVIQSEITETLQGRAAGIEVSEKESTPVAARSSDVITKKVNEVNNSSVSGKVTSADNGAPLPGVNVVVKGSTQGTVTDIDGKYKIEGIDTTTKNSLVFSFIGLETEEKVVDVNSPLNIEMQPDEQQLSEVIVTAEGIKRKSQALGYATSEISKEEQGSVAQPIIGLDKYNLYLEDSIRYPLGSYKTGRVVVTFNIEPDGSLTSFKIKRSLGAKEDQEAIRLIQEGPAWRPANNENISITSTAKVVVKFEKR